MSGNNAGMNQSPEALARQALALERAGRLAEAAAAYESLLRTHPDLPDCWYNLGRLQRRLHRFEAALTSYQQALDRRIGDPEEVHLNRGVIYADYLQRPDAAELELNTALALNPRYVPALLNLGNLQEDRGDRAAARALYERILALEPRHAEALARLANASTIAGSGDPIIGRLRHLLASPGVPPAEQASLGFALGRALDAAGDYDAAFDAYAQANRNSRASAPPGTPRYDRAQHERLVDELIGFFSPERCRQLAGSQAAAPVFICGMFRSGSTLAEQVLASHPRVTAGGEVDFVPAVAGRELSPFPAALARICAADIDGLAARYLQRLAALFPGADVVTDKRPDNFLYLGLIKAMFPRARIVHTTRDALDNCLSVFFLHLDHGMSYATDLMDIGHYYQEYRRLMAHWRSLYGPDILDFDYDAFVRQPRPALAGLLAHCGLGWHEGCLDFHRAGSVVKTASVWQVREPLYARSSGRWRHYERQLAPLAAYLQDLRAPGPSAAGKPAP